MDDLAARAMIKDHFDHCGRDEVRASEIYADDAVLEFPQGGERIRGKASIIAFRTAYPARLTFEMHRTVGCDDLWLNEYTIRYDGVRPHKGRRHDGVPGRQGLPREDLPDRGVGTTGLAGAMGGADGR